MNTIIDHHVLYAIMHSMHVLIMCCDRLYQIKSWQDIIMQWPLMRCTCVLAWKLAVWIVGDAVLEHDDNNATFY